MTLGVVLKTTNELRINNDLEINNRHWATDVQINCFINAQFEQASFNLLSVYFLHFHQLLS